MKIIVKTCESPLDKRASKPGRTSDADITVFDATGMALLDLAAAGMLLKGI